MLCNIALIILPLRRLGVVGHERRAQGGGVVGGGNVFHLREAVDDRGEVEAVSGGCGMYAVLREKRFSCAGTEVLSAHHERAGLYGVDHAWTEADGRDAVVVGELLHGACGAVACTGEVVLLHGFGDRVGEYDVGSGVLLPRLAHDALHGTPDVLRRRSAVVGGELHEKEVGVVAERVVRHAECAEIRSGAADGGVDFLDLRLRVSGWIGGTDREEQVLSCNYRQAALRRNGLTVSMILLQMLPFATSISYWLCKFCQTSGVVPKNLAKRSAVSADMPRRPSTISFTRRRGT